MAVTDVGWELEINYHDVGKNNIQQR